MNTTKYIASVRKKVENISKNNNNISMDEIDNQRNFNNRSQLNIKQLVTGLQP